MQSILSRTTEGKQPFVLHTRPCVSIHIIFNLARLLIAAQLAELNEMEKPPEIHLNK